MNKKQTQRTCFFYALIFLSWILFFPSAFCVEDTSTITIEDISLKEDEMGYALIQVETNETLGSFTIELEWDPQVIIILDVISDDFVINHYSNASEGTSRIVGFSMQGSTGQVSLARLHLQATGAAGSTSLISLISCELLTPDPIPNEIVCEMYSGSITITSSSDGGNGGSQDPPDDTPNQPPIADASAGVPYQGSIFEDIYFDGSNSEDIDGFITDWHWDFGDGTQDSGQTLIHQYDTAGTYLVILTVTDNEGATDINQTSVVIIQKNIPPSHASIIGPTTGSINTAYTYYFSARDLDSDMIRYHIEWGDDQTNSSNSIQQNTTFTLTHAWDEPGVYHIHLTAEDEQNTTSTPIQYMVLIDVTEVYLNGSLFGYLYDSNNDGILDFFQQLNSQTKITLHKQNETYYIDISNNGIWDYQYTEQTGFSFYQNELDKEGSSNDTPGFTFITVILGLMILVLFWRKQKI